MVRSNQTHRSLRNQSRARERDEAEYGKRMVQRFEKTGKLATSTTQKGVAEYEWSRLTDEERAAKLAESEWAKLSPAEQNRLRTREEMRGRRNAPGSVPLAPNLQELLAAWQARQAWMPATYVYECADCGKETTYHRKAGASAPRCGSCKTAARRASKRKTWHKNKEKYVANKNNKLTKTLDAIGPEIESEPVLVLAQELQEISPEAVSANAPVTKETEVRPVSPPVRPPVVGGRRRVVWTSR